MWIESIDLNDFGLFDRARLDGLENGLNVVAGPQRAGKTTFMEAVRYLGYGLTTGTDVPPPADEYDVSATVVKDGYRYGLDIEGYAKPRVAALDPGAPDQTARQLFGEMRKTQYQQLYTVSLDELDRHPSSLDADVDLSSILLEAAAGGNITDVPDLRDEFSGRAKEIGGKHGRRAYRLKGPLETIEEGIEARDSATAQVDEHERVSNERIKVEERIAEIETEIAATETERTRLEAVAKSHETYEEFQAAESDLAAMDVEDADQFPLGELETAKRLRGDLQDETTACEEARRAFQTAVDVADPDAYRDALLESATAIEDYSRAQAGWEERVQTIQSDQADLEDTRRELARRAESLGPDWDGDPLARVDAFDTDRFAQDTVDRAVDQYESAQETVERVSQRIAELETRHDELSDRIDEATETESGPALRAVIPAAAVGTILALGAGIGTAVLVNPTIGVVVTALVLLVTGSYATAQLDAETPSHQGVAVDTLRAEREKIESELEAKRAQLETHEGDLADAEETVTAVREAYDLPAEFSVDAIERFHADLVDITRALERYEDARGALEANIETFQSDLDPVVGTLHDIGVLESAIEDPFENSTAVFTAIERAEEHLDQARAVATAQESRQETAMEVVEILAEWEATASVDACDDDIATALDRFVAHGEQVSAYSDCRAKRESHRQTLVTQLGVAAYAEALEATLDDPDTSDEAWLIEAFEAVLDEHGSVDGVESRIEALDTEIQGLKDEQSEKREKSHELKQELDALASDDDVRAAHATIERGQRHLEPLAEDYATYRIGEYLLDELHERFIERTTGPLLDEASAIFQRITGDAYTEIDTRDEFDDLDFAAVLADGGVQVTDELSRATAEQLFLAVRLARIKRYEEPLPVLLDDSLTNFDPGHVERTLDVVSELSTDVQVFLLTCHPTLVDKIAASSDVQYWGLNGGSFSGPHHAAEPVTELFRDGPS